MKTLFSRFEKQLDDFEQRTVGQWYERISGKVADLEMQKKEVSLSISEEKRRRSLRSIQVRYVSFGVLMGLIGLLPVFFEKIYSLFGGKYFLEGIISSNIVVIMIGLMGVIGASVGWIFARAGKEDVEADFWADQHRQSLSEIDTELDRYRTLILTDPRLREFSRIREN